MENQTGSSSKGIKTFKLVAIALIVISAALFVGARYMFLDTKEFIQNSISTEGVVVDLEKRRSDDGTTYRPVVEFLTLDGKPIVFTSSTGTNPPNFDVGEKVEILYNPLSPEDANINSFIELWLFVVVLSFIGGVFLFISVVFFIIARKNELVTSDRVFTNTPRPPMR